MDDSPKRVVARVMAREVLATFGEMADRYGRDLLDTLVFTGIWSANVAHLSEPDVYATIFETPPEAERRPVTLAQLAAILRLDQALLGERVRGLIAAGMVVERDGGLVAPTAVFGSQMMMDGIELSYVRTLQLVQALERYGVITEVQRLGRARPGTG